MGRVDSLGYWTFTDVVEETMMDIPSFHGGFGLINKEGLKKPAYYAYYLLAKLGTEIIDKGEEHIITRDGENIQVLAYNIAYFDEELLRKGISVLSHKERYSIFEKKPIKEIEIKIEDLNGYYKVTKYKLDRENGSVFDEWINMGANEKMTSEEIEYLKGKARPKITVEYVDIDGTYEDRLYIDAHGAELIEMEKKIK